MRGNRIARVLKFVVMGVLAATAFSFGPGVVELADAGAFRMAHDHVLAGAGRAGSEQDSVWRLSRAARRGQVLAADA